GGFNDTYFAYVASFGELAAVSCFTPQSAKKAFGRAAYITRGVKTLLTLKGHRVKVTYDGGVIEGKFFLGMVSNAHSVGGFEGICGMDVDLQDGLLEVSLVKKPRRFGDMARIIDALLIDPGNEMVAQDLVYKFKTSSVTLESEEPIQWVVDGENAHTHSKVEIVNHNEAIEMMSGKPEPGTERVFLGFPWVPGNL
ncbi:MAG: hypothetical protein HUJ75_08855, partial [Parasporobacterium sp.]|nr:hypothetical protein [Parasporobacterium sp.]